MKNTKFEVLTYQYLEDKRNYWRNYTYKDCKMKIKKHILPYFEDKYVDDIKKADIIKWQQYLMDEGVTIKYINTIRSILHNIFRYACEYRDLESNPVFNTPRLKDHSPKKEMVFWEYKEYKQFIAEVDDPVYRRLFMFLYYTGARKGEARALIWDQINFNNNIITISRSLERGISVKAKQVVNAPKTGVSRTLLMNKELRETLYSYYCERKMDLNFRSDEYVFGIKYPLAEETIRRNKNKYCDKAKVKRIRLHDFRHSNASFLISLGADICVVSDRLGHKDRKQTLDRYSHMFPTRENELIEKIDAQSAIFNDYSYGLADVILNFLEKINNLQNLSENDIMMIEKIKKIV